MSFDSANSVHRYRPPTEPQERVEHDSACTDEGRADLSRHVQRLFDERNNACRPTDSASRFLPPYPADASQRGGQPDSSAFPAGGDAGSDQISQHRTRLLLDPSASPEQRLAAVRELSRCGMQNLSVQGNDGQSYNLRLETEQAGSRQMVHLYMTGADGKEHTVLRGVSDQNGQFEREKDRNGNFVGWFGSGAARLQNAISYDSPDSQRGTIRGETLDDLRRRQFPYDQNRDGPNPYDQYRNGPSPYDRPDDQYRNGPSPYDRPYDQYRNGPSPYDRPYDQYRNGPNPYDRPYDQYRGRPNPYCRPYDQPDDRNGPNPNPYNRPFNQPDDREFAPPSDGNNDSVQPRPRPFDQPAEQNGTQWLDRAAQDARNRTRQLVQTTAGIYLRSGMAVDADGSPRAKQIDPDGQLNTSMRYADNKSLNAEVVPYMVLPGGQYQRFGVQLGDMVLVRNTDNGKMAVAVFGDVGPRNKTGEGSMELAREVGLNPSPTRGGTSKTSIEYLVLPNTHGTKPRNEQELLARIAQQKQKFGIA